MAIINQPTPEEIMEWAMRHPATGCDWSVNLRGPSFDYEKLLQAYMRHLLEEEGITFVSTMNYIGSDRRKVYENLGLSEDEYAEICRLADKVTKDVNASCEGGDTIVCSGLWICCCSKCRPSAADQNK